MIMKRFCIKESIRFILILSVCGFTMSCSGDKSAEMQEEIAAAYKTAAENINNATDTESAVRISEQLQTTLSGIQAKYKDVTDNMPEEQKQTIAKFYEEQRKQLYNNASESGKKLIEAVTTVSDNAFGAAVSSVSKTLNASEKAIQDTVTSVKNAAKEIVDNAQKAAEATKEKEIKEAEGRAEAIRATRKAEADGIKFVKAAEAEGIKSIKNAEADDTVIRLKSLDAFAKAADGKATKIIIPSEIQGIAGLVKSIKEVAVDDTQK